MMKPGLLLLQSVASSALQSGRGPSSCAAAVAGRRWWFSGSVRPGWTGAALLVAAGAAAGAPTPAACGGGERHRGATEATVSAEGTERKSIDEPDDAPVQDPLLPFPESALRHDSYNGVTLDLAAVAARLSLNDAERFSIMLSRALDIWTAERRRGIWLKVPTSHSHLVAPATQLGFDYRHAEPGFCVLTKWLPADCDSRLPNGPTHQVGIGALVVHPRTGRMLAVQEQTGPAAKRKLWKMPTGLTDPGEDVAQAAVRELKEETGLDCTFDKILCFRQAHGGLFGRSDLFFMCLCRLAPTYEEIIRAGGEVELSPQEEEILAADWIDVEDYAEQDVWRESPLYKEMNDAVIKAARRCIEYTSSTNGDSGDGKDNSLHGFVAKNLPVGFRPGRNTIYVSSKL